MYNNAKRIQMSYTDASVDIFQAPKSHQNVVKTAANFFIIFLKGFKFSAFLLNSKEMALF